MFVNVKCFTNIDAYKNTIWPKQMYNPKAGDSVMSSGGLILKIYSITHSATPENIEPLLLIELHTGGI